MDHQKQLKLFYLLYFFFIFILLKNSNNEKCSESKGKYICFIKIFFFLKICPAETIASLFETIPKIISILIIIFSKKYNDLYPDIAKNLN